MCRAAEAEAKEEERLSPRVALISLAKGQGSARFPANAGTARHARADTLFPFPHRPDAARARRRLPFSGTTTERALQPGGFSRRTFPRACGVPSRLLGMFPRARYIGLDGRASAFRGFFFLHECILFLWPFFSVASSFLAHVFASSQNLSRQIART